jgi:DNA-binding response OmpR family regulator
MRILVVHQDADLATVQASVLVKNGFHTFIACSKEIAFASALKNKVHVVLIDPDFPQKGLLARTIRKYRPNTKVIRSIDRLLFREPVSV